MKHPPTEIERFVRAVDAALTEPASILVIGGAAAVLGYRATRPTEDIDTFHQVQPKVQRAVEAATVATKLKIPVSFAAVADAPYNFEDRLVPLTELGLTHLTVVVPERHDLALMKMIRGYQHDVEVIEQIHHQQPLSLDILRERFVNGGLSDKASGGGHGPENAHCDSACWQMGSQPGPFGWLAV